MKRFNNLQTILRRMKPGIIAILLCWSAVTGASAQVTITNPYPAAAQSLTRGLDTSLLTVEVNFLGACTGNTATITLAPGVTYIPGSVAKIAGNAGITIADLAGTANAPTFTISGVTAAGSITFTVKRTAGCGMAASGKDVVSVTGSCGTVTESDININSYNLLSPALSLTSPASVTNAVTGTTAGRTISITNGGNGCLDTLRYYVVYPAGGIVNTNAGNAITANGQSFAPSATSGDTLFYKIAGTTVFGGNNLLCNGETVTIVENIRVVTCNTTTAYGAGWGNTSNALCQVSTGSGTLTMANGVAILSTTIVENTEMSPCAPGTVTVTFSNTGNGGQAGGMYNIIAQLGNLNPNAINTLFGPTTTAGNNSTASIFFNNFMINGSSVTVTQTGSNPWEINMSQFVGSDPDGVGGLEDLDGDGQFDDLAPGSSFVVTMNRNYGFLAQCVKPDYYRVIASKLTFNSMCGTLTTPLAKSGGTIAQALPNNISETVPTLVAGGVPFNTRACLIGFFGSNFTRPTDSMYIEIDLPAGVSYVPGTGQYNSGSATITNTGTKLFIAQIKGGVSSFCFSADFVYNDCGVSLNLNFPYKIYHVLDRSCNAIEYFECGSFDVQVKCPQPCPTGMANYSPTAERVNYGWTNTSMTTIVNPATLPSLSRKSATVFDTIRIIQPAEQSGTYSNLYYSYELNKSAGSDVVKFESGTLNFKAGGTGPTISCVIPAYNNLSTGTLTKWVWNLTPLLGGACGLPASLNSGDSVWVDMKLSVTNANNNALFGGTLTAPPNQLSYMYNLDGNSVEQFCDKWAPDYYLLGLGISVNGSLGQSNVNLIGCSPVLSNFANYSLITGEGGDAFPLEYRPGVTIDSMVVTFPAGITWTGVNPHMTVYTFNTSNPFAPTAINQSTLAVMNGNQLVLKNPGTWIFNDLLPSTYVQRHNTYFQIVASCEAVAANNNFTVTTYGKSFVYAGANIPFVSSFTANGGPGSLTATYDVTTKPSITLQNNTGAVQGILPQHYWDVQVNSTGTTTAPYVWLALEKAATSGIVVDSVVLKPSNVVMTPMSYGTGNKWYQVSAAGLTSGASQQARVYFKYTNCSNDSILMRSGWNCTGYPSPDPATGYACTSADQYLKVIPQSSQVQIAMDYQPAGTINLCSQDSVTVIVNSAQAANLVNPNVVIYPPAGVTFSTPFPVEYPLGSGIWQDVTPVGITGGGYQINLSNHSGIGANGLPGTALNPGAAGRQAKIKLPFSASCSFVSGSQLDFFVHGAKPCGNAADGDGLDVKSNPVKITGANATGNAAVSMSLSGSTTMTCGESRSIGLSVTAVGTTTQAGDTAVYAIPAGLNYAGNFSGCATCSITTASTAGATLVKVALPAGLPSGTTTSFSFDIAAANGGGCGTLSVNGQVERSIGGLFCGMTPCTTSKVVIGTGTPVPVTVNKPNLTITALTRTTPGFFMPGSTHTLSVSVSNSSTIAVPASAYIVEFFCGSSSTPFASGSFPAAIAAGSSATANMTISVPAAPACNIGDAVTAKISPVTTTNTVQCICSETVFTMSEVLPLRLVQFEAGMQECKATLSWKTVEEHNFRHFEVEYSANAHSFEKVGTVAGRNSASGGVYTFDFVQPAGKGYYRLKMVDLDGAAQLSNTIATEADCGAQNTITLYPNPTQGLVEVSNVISGSIIRVYDHTGRLVLSKVAQQAKESINLGGFAAGSYVLVVINGTEQVFRTKVIRQ